MILTERQQDILHKLSQLTPHAAMIFAGHNRGAANRLVQLGLAKSLGPDRWTGELFQITPAGRKAAKQ